MKTNNIIVLLLVSLLMSCASVGQTDQKSTLDGSTEANVEVTGLWFPINNGTGYAFTAIDTSYQCSVYMRSSGVYRQYNDSEGLEIVLLTHPDGKTELLPSFNGIWVNRDDPKLPRFDDKCGEHVLSFPDTTLLDKYQQ